jgi:hypothetical protein
MRGIGIFVVFEPIDFFEIFHAVQLAAIAFEKIACDLGAQFFVTGPVCAGRYQCDHK